MEKQFSFKKTSDLSENEKEQIRSLFHQVFKKEMKAEEFEKRFLCSCKGYSYHGLMLHERVIVGSFSAIPYRYNYFGKEVIFGLSVDTMITKEHRGGANNLRVMAKLVYDAMVEDGIPVIYGFPNELYYGYEKKIHNTRDIGKLSYYILPVNVGNVLNKMKFLNPLSRLFAKTWISLPSYSKKQTYQYNIEKIADDLFETHRYDDTYKTIQLSDGAKGIFKVYEEEGGVRALHIIDVLPLAPKPFAEAVKKVYELSAKDIDIIIYVGNLSFNPLKLFKVPDSKEPQKIRLTGKILMPEIVEDSIFTIENWNVNVSNFDVR